MAMIIRAAYFSLLFTVCFTVFAGPAHSSEADENVTKIGGPPQYIHEPIQFMEHAPIIDGSLDSTLSYLTVRDFSQPIPEQYDGASPQANYRLGYGTDFFYVYIEAEADSLIYRDRAYQMGDGFHMVLARPHTDGSPTEEFYVLACSAVNNPNMEWSRRIFWYYNVYDIFKRTGEDTKLEFHEGNGKISFELLLPWKDVHPYHPWISEGLGFNLRFVKALGEDGKVYYEVLHDDHIDSELQPRQYALMRFAEPVVTGGPQTFVLSDRGHIFEGDSLTLTSATSAGEAGEQTVQVRLLANDSDVVSSTESSYNLKPGVTTHSIAVDTRSLIAGEYLIAWQTDKGECQGKSKLTILPRFDADEIRGKLRKAAFAMKSSSLSTLEFRLQDILEQIDSAKSYETCPQTLVGVRQLRHDVDEAVTGVDPYSTLTGFVRKAYRSTLDSSLQPYMMWVPENYDSGHAYPLLVYLHGSASTESAFSNAKKMIPDGFIALAPRGRGTSNCFTFDHAQMDIAEAISAVVADYPIDTTNIVLAGFSMGGYGVYRTFYETPGKFKALAIFSGHPDIANTWYPGNDYPDFTSRKILEPFKSVPIFIFHGAQDRNAPYELTKQVVTELKALGCQVEFHTETDKGHERASEETYAAYYEWIERVLRVK